MQYQKYRGMKRFLLSGYLQPYLDTFIKDLSNQGYTSLSIEVYCRSVAHFGTWLQKEGISLKNINSKVVTAFAEHHCRCPGGRRIKKVSRDYVARVRRFIFYLHQQGIIILQDNSTHISSSSTLLIKFKDFLLSRNLAPSTIECYMRIISELLLHLGSDPNKYDAVLIRQVICNITKNCSPSVTKMLITALRSYLRFLAIEERCLPNLESAVPTVAQWKLSSLPKYLTIDEFERLVISCNVHTKQGLRDRAIILFLGRLGLRVGDIVNMLFDDINWNEGTIRLCGKGKREAILPIPQDVGDALLSYLEKGRPLVPIRQVFLCLNAPFRSLALSGSVSTIVCSGLSRAGITNPPSRGANLLRHSAATTMLRRGYTLESVSTVLRHRSLDMTCHYAKVDIPMLMQIVQPWPEGAPC
jgi:integrase/recombinase XerD